MNYSLLRADYRTHLKILALAVFASAVLGFGAHGTNIASGEITSTISVVAKPHLNNARPFAQMNNVSVCRINAL